MGHWLRGGDGCGCGNGEGYWMWPWLLDKLGGWKSLIEPLLVLGIAHPVSHLLPLIAARDACFKNRGSWTHFRLRGSAARESIVQGNFTVQYRAERRVRQAETKIEQCGIPRTLRS